MLTICQKCVACDRHQHLGNPRLERQEALGFLVANQLEPLAMLKLGLGFDQLLTSLEECREQTDSQFKLAPSSGRVASSAGPGAGRDAQQETSRPTHPPRPRRSTRRLSGVISDTHTDLSALGVDAR
jgi:hypothetical protein